MIRSNNIIGSNYNYNHSNGDDINSNVLIKEANELCEEIGDLVDSIYDNFSPHEFADRNSRPVAQNCNHNHGWNGDSGVYSPNKCYNTYTNELMKKKMEKDKLIYCNNKLNEIKGLLDNIKEPEKTYRKNGVAWEIDENYLKQFQLKLNIRNQQEVIREKLNQAEKLKLSDYYNLHFKKTRSKSSPSSNLTPDRSDVSRVKTTPCFSNPTGGRSAVVAGSPSSDMAGYGHYSMHNLNYSPQNGNCGHIAQKAHSAYNLQKSNHAYAMRNSNSGYSMPHSNHNHAFNGKPNVGYNTATANTHAGHYVASGNPNAMSGSNMNANTCKLFNFNQYSSTSRSEPNHQNGWSNHTPNAMSNMYRASGTGRLSRDGTMMYVKGNIKMNSNVLHNTPNQTGYLRFNNVNGSNLAGTTRSAAGGRYVGTPTAVFVPTSNPASTFSPFRPTVPRSSSSAIRLKREDTFGAVEANKCVWSCATNPCVDNEDSDDNSNTVATDDDYTTCDSKNAVCDSSDNGCGIDSYTTLNSGAKNEDSDYYKFDTIDDLMEYENDEYYCRSMGPLPQLSNSNDKLLDKLFEGSQPAGSAKNLAIPAVRNVAGATPINTNSNTAENTTQANTTSTNTPVGSRSATDNLMLASGDPGSDEPAAEAGAKLSGDTVKVQEYTFSVDSSDLDCARGGKACKHYHYYEISSVSGCRKASGHKRRCRHHSKTHCSPPDACSSNCKHKCNRSASKPGSDGGQEALAVERAVYKAKVIGPSVQ